MKDISKPSQHCIIKDVAFLSAYFRLTGFVPCTHLYYSCTGTALLSIKYPDHYHIIRLGMLLRCGLASSLENCVY
jgi:hypothetical protein